MILEVLLDGSSVLRRISGHGLGERLAASGESSVSAMLQDWSERYARAVRTRSDAALLEIGREMFGWLDQGAALDAWMAGDPRALTIQTSFRDDPAIAGVLLAAPWELLADRTGFLAQDMRLFTVARQAHGPSVPRTPDYKDISLLFMAAAPREQTPLDHEREEAVILEATRPRLGQPAPVHLQVEESGTLEFLAEASRLQGPFEAVHISCHGNIQPQEGGPPQPVLFLETDEGAPHAVTVDGLKTGLDKTPPLLFLSACQTAQRGKGHGLPLPEGFRREAGSNAAQRDAGSDLEEAAPDLADPFVRQFSAFTANVVGWDGSVYDSEAMSFASTFYGELSRGDSVPKAAAKARRKLLRERTPENPVHEGAHWHLARVYLGPGGGGPICDPRATTARPARPDTEQAFLGERVPVAGRDTFVGRRREIQRIIAAYRTGTQGVVIHGMGNLGKSSLAARVADRMAGYRTAVVYGQVTTRTLVEALGKVLDEIAATLPLAEGNALREDIAMLKEEVGTDPGALGSVLHRLLAGPLNTHPVLLVLDDFEQSLVPPSAEDQKIVPSRAMLATVRDLLMTMNAVPTQSRLLITSRYDFALPDAHKDPSSTLRRIALVPMEHRDRMKQVRAKAQVGKVADRLSERQDLVLEALEVAAGNPGLQDVLTGSILNGEEEAAQDAIAQIRAFRESGTVPPEGSDLGDFFTRMAFHRYAAALTPAQATALGAAAIFSEEVPIPAPAMEATIAAAGVSAAAPALDRLVALGLVDDWGGMSAWPDTPALPHLAVNPLARRLGETVPEAEIAFLADAALPALGIAWRDHEGDFPRDPRGLEAARLGLLARTPDPALLNAAANAATAFLYHREARAQAAVDLGQALLARLETFGHAPNPSFIGTLINASGRIGAVDLLKSLIDRTLDRTDIDALHRGQLHVWKGDQQATEGGITDAMVSYGIAKTLFRENGHDRELAVTRGKIADILQAQGDLAEALRIREEEEIPVYEVLGDRRSIAVTRGQIADILEAQGDLAEALRIREEDCIPVFEALGDRREIAVTRGKIADILQAQGEFDTALEMHLSRLPGAQERKDAEVIAHIRYSCAGIRLSRGDHERGEIQVIYDELTEAYGIMMQIGRADSIGGIGSLLGQVLGMGGHTEEARTVLGQARAAFERLGNAGGVAHCDKLIEIISERGDT